ncbi:extracellular solute-binding protein [Micromonospora sp. NPDC048930]|uniref:extracellular solute-binding protein n=1 Tax=Micromonospora sp. NPDC048930 TaxID=3364261 RepID=UPI003722AC8A
MHPSRTRRRILAAAAATLTAIGLTACGSDDTSADADGPVSGTITFWHGYNSDSKEVKTLREVVIPAFKAKHPGTDVKEVSVPDKDLHQKLITAVAGGKLPDVVRADIAWVPELAKLGVLERLDRSMPDFHSFADKVFPGTLATNKYKGGYYGLPLDTNTRVQMYNANALAKAGVTAPPRTFDDLRALADKLAATNVSAFADSGMGGWNILPWIWSAGGDITDPEYTKATGHLNSPESLAGVQLLYDLYRKGQLGKGVLGGTGATPTDQGLAKGQYATILDGPWMYPIFAKTFPGFQLRAAAVPAGPGGSVSVVGGEDAVVMNSTSNKALALEFTRYLLSDEAQLAMAKVGQMSVLKDLDVTSVDPNYAPFVEQLKTARPRPVVPTWPKIDEVLQKKLQAAFRGETSLQQALDSAAADIDKLLA